MSSWYLDHDIQPEDKDPELLCTIIKCRPYTLKFDAGKIYELSFNSEVFPVGTRMVLRQAEAAN